MKPNKKGYLLLILLCLMLALSFNSCTPGEDSNPDTTKAASSGDTTKASTVSGTDTSKSGLSVADDTDGSGYGELHLVD